MRGVIDRFEGEVAVVEGEDRVNVEIPRHLIPKEAKEGDSIIQIDDNYIIDEDETQRRRNEIEALSKGLWE